MSEYAVRQIENLLARYTFAMDDANWPALEGLFSESIVEMGDAVHGGREGVRNFISGLQLHEGSLKTKHLCSNIYITVDEETGRANARSYWTVLQALPELPLQAVSTGTYRDQFVHEHGLWRFARRSISVDLAGDRRHLIAADRH